jgi:hypothetical protein
MTVLDLITMALAILNSVAVGDTVAPEDSTFMLNVINALISSWNASVKKSMYGLFDPSLFTFNAVSQLVNLTDSVTGLPNGWIRALAYNAAVDASVPYEKQISEGVAAIAKEARAAILTPQGGPVQA